MKKVRKLLKALLPRVLDVCVYEHMLSIEPPDVVAAIAVDIEVKQHSKGYSFYAMYNGTRVNENHIIFNNRLGKQLGYNDVPMLADSNTYEAYRGKGIQAYVLTELVRYFASVKEYSAIYVFTYAHNTAMQSALAKAGYTKLKRMLVYRIAGICVYKRRIHE